VNAPDRISRWLSTDIRPVLRARGWTKSGSTFHLRKPEGWGVINFQKSPWGSREETRLTINLGVALDALAPTFDRDPTKEPPEHMCHWQTRIGWLMEPARDTWWIVNSGTDFAELANEIGLALVDLALPAINERLTAEGFLRASREDNRIGQYWISVEGEAVLEPDPVDARQR
jgi:hypothetical protein